MIDRWKALSLARRIAMGALVMLVICLAAWWLVATLVGGKTAKVEARINQNQTAAAIASGSDAVETIGRQIAAEDEDDVITKGNADEIRNAQGADAPVDPDVAGAGRRGLCRRAAYRDSPECLQQPAAE